jgi:hypothetical protein
MRGISRDGMKVEPFLHILAARLTGERRATWCEWDQQWYLGGGYWRAVAGEEREDLEFGRVYLRNPDYTPEEIQRIEIAMGLLLSPRDTRNEL